MLAPTGYVLVGGATPASSARRAPRSVPPLRYFSSRATFVCLAFARPRPIWLDLLQAEPRLRRRRDPVVLVSCGVCTSYDAVQRLAGRANAVHVVLDGCAGEPLRSELTAVVPTVPVRCGAPQGARGTPSGPAPPTHTRRSWPTSRKRRSASRSAATAVGTRSATAVSSTRRVVSKIPAARRLARSKLKPSISSATWMRPPEFTA